MARKIYLTISGKCKTVDPDTINLSLLSRQSSKADIEILSDFNVKNNQYFADILIVVDDNADTVKLFDSLRVKAPGLPRHRPEFTITDSK